MSTIGQITRAILKLQSDDPFGKSFQPSLDKCDQLLRSLPSTTDPLLLNILQLRVHLIAKSAITASILLSEIRAFPLDCTPLRNKLRILASNTRHLLPKTIQIALEKQTASYDLSATSLTLDPSVIEILRMQRELEMMNPFDPAFPQKAKRLVLKVQNSNSEAVKELNASLRFHYNEWNRVIRSMQTVVQKMDDWLTKPNYDASNAMIGYHILQALETMPEIYREGLNDKLRPAYDRAKFLQIHACIELVLRQLASNSLDVAPNEAIVRMNSFQTALTRLKPCNISDTEMATLDGKITRAINECRTLIKADVEAAYYITSGVNFLSATTPPPSAPPSQAPNSLKTPTQPDSPKVATFPGTPQPDSPKVATFPGTPQPDSPGVATFPGAPQRGSPGAAPNSLKTPTQPGTPGVAIAFGTPRSASPPQSL